MLTKVDSRKRARAAAHHMSQLCVHCLRKELNYNCYEKNNKSSVMHTSSSFSSYEKIKLQTMKKESLNECCYGNQNINDTPTAENSSEHFSNTADYSSLLQPVESWEQPEAAWALRKMSSAENVTCSQYRRQSFENLFLDFESVRLSKEDEDSASDLSDSERVPIPPSPLTPPKLNLRAEEIKPGYFSEYVEHKSKEYEYPDFLPPPYNTWNLREVSMYVNKEGKNTLQSKASAPLERYVDRLLHLEWLQMQTVQSEKTKMGKSRPQTVPAPCRNGKSPGKCKPWPSPLPSKNVSNSDNVTKTSTGQDKNYHKKYTHREPYGATCLRKNCPKVFGTVDVHQSAPKQTQDVRCKKKSTTSCPQTKNVLISDPKIQCAGNIRPQRQTFVSSSAESIPKHTKASKIRKSELSVSNHVTNRHCILERKK
ncbi:protein FAM217B isoform X1 [Ranitomeya imitator]|uniref:protein FAM217B isoform X1 n=1 Tax=Ranitomeya imitator TaxID=111125 RepID=UPI0037E8CFFC